MTHRLRNTGKAREHGREQCPGKADSTHKGLEVRSRSRRLSCSGGRTQRRTQEKAGGQWAQARTRNKQATVPTLSSEWRWQNSLVRQENHGPEKNSSLSMMPSIQRSNKVGPGILGNCTPQPKCVPARTCGQTVITHKATTRQALESLWPGQDQLVGLKPGRPGDGGSSPSRVDGWRQMAKPREKQASTERVRPDPISHKAAQRPRSWGRRGKGRRASHISNGGLGGRVQVLGLRA